MFLFDNLQNMHKFSI